MHKKEQKLLSAVVESDNDMDPTKPLAKKELLNFLKRIKMEFHEKDLTHLEPLLKAEGYQSVSKEKVERYGQEWTCLTWIKNF